MAEDDDRSNNPIWLLRDRAETVIPTPGKEITWHEMPFRLSTKERVAAAMSGGAPAWSIRLRRIDEWHTRLEAGLLTAAEELYAALGGAALFDRAWRDELDRVDLTPVNDLIDSHNRFFPVEANLRTDVTTGRLMWGDEPFEPRPLVSREWLRARYPSAWALGRLASPRGGVNDRGRPGVL